MPYNPLLPDLHTTQTPVWPCKHCGRVFLHPTGRQLHTGNQDCPGADRELIDAIRNGEIAWSPR